MRVAILLATSLGLSCSAAFAQLPNEGFDQSVTAVASNAEVVRQQDIWVMEVQFKPTRMVWVEINGKKEEIWYLPWRAICRPQVTRSPDASQPVNPSDPLPGPTFFVPQLTLVTYDNPATEIPNKMITDQVIPEALKAIRPIEGRHQKDYSDTVSVIREVPEPVASDAEQQPWIYGVATWKGVPRDTDFFKVIFEGFSNGYEVRTSMDGSSEVWRKIFVQKFKRPGDEFDPNIKEFAFDGIPRWTYQPDGSTPVVADATPE